MANVVQAIVGISIAVVAFASVFMYTLKNTDTTGWSGGEVALWSILGLAGIAGLATAAFGIFGG